MAKDFKASQVRTSQIIVSSSLSTRPSLMVLSASSAGVDFDGSVTLPSSVGNDVFVYVSGSTNSFGTENRGVTLFGGDVVVSGTAYNNTGNPYATVAGSDKQVQFNDGGQLGADSGLTYNKNTDSLSVGNLYVTGTSTALNVSGSVLIAGNLEVRGMITGSTLVITSTNVTISDPVVYIASGSVGVGTKSIIAFASGSQTPNQSLIFGSVGVGDILAGGRLDVQAGALQQSNIGFDNLVPFAGSSFFVGSTNAYISSSNATALELAASTQVLVLSGGSASSLNPKSFTDTNFYVSGAIGSKDTSTRGTSVFGGDVVISGTLHGSAIRSLQNVASAISLTTNKGSSETIVVTNTQGTSESAITLTSTAGGVDIDASASKDVDISGGQVKISSKDDVSPAISLTTNQGTSETISILNAQGTSTSAISLITLAGGINANAMSGPVTILAASAMDLQGVGDSQLEITNGNLSLEALSDGNVILNAASTSDNSKGVVEFQRNSVKYLTLSSSFVNSSVRLATMKLGTEPGAFAFTSLTGDKFEGNQKFLGDDVLFIVSGAIGSKGTGTRGTSVFGGDVVISGTLHGGSPLKVSGSMALSGSLRLQTQDSAPTVGSNESVLYVLNDGGTKKLYWKNSDGTQQQVGTGGGSGATSGTFNEPSPAEFVTTASVSIAGGRGFGYTADSVGSDTYFFVSGTKGSRGTATKGTSVFGGDTVISGTAYFEQGLSGSLTKLGDGTSYLIAGVGTTIVTGSTGAVTIGINDAVVATVSGTTFTGNVRANKFEIGGSSLFISSTNNGNSLLIRNSNPVSDISIFAGSTYGTATSAKLALTASAVKIGSVVGQPELPDIGADTFLYVSGSGGTKDSSTRGVSVFGGDVVISGTLYGGSPLKVSGGLQLTGTLDMSTNSKITASALSGSLTKLADGTSYLIAGSNVTLTTGSNGAVTIASTGGGGGTPGGTDTQVQFNDGGSTFGGDAGLTYTKGTDTLNVTNVAMTATADQTWNLVDNSGGALNISAGTGNNRWTFNTGDGQERLGFWDNVKAGFGDINDPDLTIYHDGTNSLIRNKTGKLILSGVSAGLEVTGTTKFAQGLSGSLTSLTDGSPYLIAGSNITLTTGSGGAVTIASTGGGGTGTGFNDGGNKLNTTSSVAFAGGLTNGAFPYYASDAGSDVFLFVSGASGIPFGGPAPALSNMTLFNGDIAVSGALRGKTNLLVPNSLIAASDVTIFSNPAFSNLNYTGQSDIFTLFGGTAGSKDTTTKGVSVFQGDVMLSGSSYVASGSAILPVVDRGSDLGSASKRWGNVYTGDLHLRNDRGDWTIVEEEDYLCVVNNKTGKKFKMALIPLEE